MRSFVVTTSWDDGHPLDRKVADLLDRYGLQGTFYIPRQAEHGVMAPEAVQEIATRFEVGGHTLNHTVLTTVSDAVAEREISESQKYLEDVIGKSCNVFCFPRGKYHKRHLGLVRRAGFRGVRTVELMSLGLPRVEDGLMVIPTTIQAFPHHSTDYVKNAIKRFSAKNLWTGCAVAKSGDWLRTAESLLLLAARHGGVFHLWGHSWEIEQVGQWRQLEEVLRLLSEVRTHACPVDNSGLFTYSPGSKTSQLGG